MGWAGPVLSAVTLAASSYSALKGAEGQEDALKRKRQAYDKSIATADALKMKQIEEASKYQKKEPDLAAILTASAKSGSRGLRSTMLFGQNRPLGGR